MYAAHKYHLFFWLNKKSLFIQRALHFFLNRLMVILLIWWFSLTGSSSRPQSARILRPCHPSPECWWWTTEDVPLLCVVIVLYFKVVDNVLKKMLLTVSCKTDLTFVLVRARYRFLPLLSLRFWCFAGFVFLAIPALFRPALNKLPLTNFPPSCAYIEKSSLTRVRKFFV